MKKLQRIMAILPLALLMGTSNAFDIEWKCPTLKEISLDYGDACGPHHSPYTPRLYAFSGKLANSEGESVDMKGGKACLMEHPFSVLEHISRTRLEQDHASCDYSVVKGRSLDISLSTSDTSDIKIGSTSCTLSGGSLIGNACHGENCVIKCPVNSRP